MLSLNTIKKTKGSAKKTKRIGRGNASGHGTYSTKGLKGQKARSGVSNLKRLGMRKQLLSIPKVRGFKSGKPKNQVVSIKAINKNFKDNEIVNPTTLAEKKLINSAELPVKILGKEKLTVKVTFEKVGTSEPVKGQIK
jgi:large subunit ribosomal protein L15